MRTRFLTGDVNWVEYGACWVSPKQNNGDWDYWLVVQFTNMDEACGSDNEGQPKYVVEVLAVSPDAAGEERVKAAMECCGIPDEGEEVSDLMKVEALVGYGLCVTCDTFTGNDARKVVRKAKRSLDCIAGMFGFFMDGPKNRLGHTGWDFIAGDLSMETAKANVERWGEAVPGNMHVV
jgi:hypothetical protein